MSSNANSGWANPEDRSRQPDQAEEGRDGTGQEQEKTHLLVVEDEPTIRQLFAMLLTAAGYSVAEADDGFAALEEVRRKRPALILSDLNMPRMTGFELLSVIRRRFPSIRVIAMSGAFAGDSVPDGVSADAFYEKSGRHISTLVEVIEEILDKPEVHSARDGRPVVSDPYPSVALWVTRRGNPIDGPYILLTCPECLRSFPHFADGGHTMQVQSTPCVFCNAAISYALLDPSLTHHPGYAPSKAR
jgi:CheY-like chemotaxis protein